MARPISVTRKRSLSPGANRCWPGESPKSVSQSAARTNGRGISRPRGFSSRSGATSPATGQVALSGHSAQEDAVGLAQNRRSRALKSAPRRAEPGCASSAIGSFAVSVRRRGYKLSGWAMIRCSFCRFGYARRQPFFISLVMPADQGRGHSSSGRPSFRSRLRPVVGLYGRFTNQGGLRFRSSAAAHGSI